MATTEDLIRWKTDAWKAPEMVAWYSGQMVANAGVIPLKNEVELDILRQYAVGRELLDVGVGTGRGSLPFARDGWQVTGIDSSAAMLEETRRLAAGTPVELKVGDVTSLPVADGAFDTVMALNVMVHVPHWQAALDEWTRKARPGGRILFDVNSLDHRNTVHGTRHGYRDLIPQDAQAFGGFMLAIRRDEVLDYAAARGLGVTAVVPYGLLASDSSDIPWRGAILRQQRWWTRLLAWVSADARLFAFCRWIERRLLPALPTTASGRFMVVLEKPAGAPAAPPPAADDCRPEAVAQRIGVPLAALAEELSGHLRHPRCRVVAYLLLDALAGRGVVPPLESFLSDDLAAAFRRWRAEDEDDRRSLAVVEGWFEQPQAAPETAYRGVPLGGALAYDALRPLLAEGFGVYAGEGR